MSVISDSEELIVEFTKKNKKWIDELKTKQKDYDVSFAYRHGKSHEMLPTGVNNIIAGTEISNRSKG